MSPLLERASCSFIATQMSRTLDWSSICSSDHKTRVKFLEAVANWSSITYPPSHSVRPANMSLVPLYVVCSHSCLFFSLLGHARLTGPSGTGCLICAQSSQSLFVISDGHAAAWSADLKEFTVIHNIHTILGFIDNLA